MARERSPSSVALETIKVILGGIAGLVFAWAIAKYGLGRDPFGSSTQSTANKAGTAVVMRPTIEISPPTIQVDSPSNPSARSTPTSVKPAEANQGKGKEPRETVVPDENDEPPTIIIKNASPRTAIEDDEPEEPKTVTVKSEEVEVGAVVSVAKCRPVPIEPKGRDKLPPEFLGGTEFEWISPPKSAQIENGELNFTVEKSGWVYLAAYWYYEGNNSGGWLDTRLTKDQLIERGWQHLGLCPWDGAPPEKPVELFRKFCNAGETYSIRTNKYGPPALFTPPGG